MRLVNGLPRMLLSRSTVSLWLMSFIHCVPVLAGSDPSGLCRRVNEYFSNLKHAEVQQLVDSIRRAPERSNDALTLAGVFEARLLRRQGRLLEAYKVIGPLVSSSAGSSVPIVQLACLKEQAVLLKAMKLLDQAQNAAFRAYHVALAIRQHEDEVDLQILLAEIDRHQGSYTAGLDRLNDAEVLANKWSYAQGLCNLLLVRANLYYDQQRDPEALQGYRRALACARQKHHSGLAINAAINIGSALHYVDGPKAGIAFYDSLMAVTDIVADPAVEADVRNNIGTIANSMGDRTRARKEITRAMGIFHALGDTTSLATSYQFLSRTLMDMGRIDSALHMASRAAEIAAAAGLKELWADAELRLSEIYDRDGRCEEAMAHLIKSHELRIELTRDKHSERMGFLEVQFETEKKEQQLAVSQADLRISQDQERAKRAQRNWLIGLSALLVLLAVVLFRNYNSQKRLRAQEQVLHEREVNDLLKQQEINSLDAMMKGQEQERQRVGKDLHDRIGSMLSAVKLQFSALEGRMEQMETHQREQYQHVFNLLDETVTEVRRISHDMVRGTISQFGLVRALEDLRSAVHVPGKLDVTMSMFGMEERLEQNMEIAAYRMVQECVSNVMKHAHAKDLTIQLTRTTAALNILVEDDGRGFDMVGTEAGMGMTNIRERAAAYKGSVNVDSRPGRGTSVSIDLPLIRLPEVG